MSREMLDKIVRSVLYEGYLLYPYRRSALKNRHRWNFGLVYPAGMSPCMMVTECLLQGGADASVSVEVRFLQLHEEDSWQKAFERSVRVADIGNHEFDFSDIRGQVEVTRTDLQDSLHKIRVQITNHSLRDKSQNPLLQCLVSTHTILTARDGHFISLLDPPDSMRSAATQCTNIGTWPVLVGREGDKDCLLSSPIMLYDYPRVADESPGDLFDSTEIDEILILRIMTLTDAEKEEMRRCGARERALLERVESLTPEQLLKLHGTMRDTGAGLKRGDRVRLHPKSGGDIFDVVLAGRIAVVESVEHDFDNRIHVAVVIEDDPGKDFGLMRQPGHRFFFSVDEVELMA